MEPLDLEVATEFLLIAATLVELKTRRLLPGPRRRRPRRGAGPVGGARPAAGPAARVQDVQGRGAGPGPLRRGRRPARTPAPPGSRSASSPWRPTCWPASRPTTCGPPSCGPPTPKPVPRVDLDHVAPIRVSVADAVEELIDELPRRGRHHLPAPHRRAWSTALEVIVRFLAVLELYKQGLVELDQAGDLRRDRDHLGRAPTRAPPSWPWPASTPTRAEPARRPATWTTGVSGPIDGRCADLPADRCGPSRPS